MNDKKTEKTLRFRTSRAVLIFSILYLFTIMSVLMLLPLLFKNQHAAKTVLFFPMIILILCILFYIETRNKLYLTKDMMQYKMNRGYTRKTLSLKKEDIKYFKMMSKNEILANNTLSFDNKFKEEIQSNKKIDAKFIVFFLTNGNYEWIDISMYQLDIVHSIGAAFVVYWDLDEYFEEEENDG